jgi:hypothetical protein
VQGRAGHRVERPVQGLLAIMLTVAPAVPVTSDAIEPVPIEVPADPPAVAPVRAASEPPSGVISGRVEHSEYPLPIENAVVELSCACLDGRRSTVTSRHGVYVFTNLPPGEYTVSVFTDVAAPERSRSAILADNEKRRVSFVSAQPSSIEPLVVIEPSVMTSRVCTLGPRGCKCGVITDGDRRRAERRERRRARRLARE